MPTARQPLTAAAWTNLGAAPLMVQVEYGRVHLVVDTAAPSTANIAAIPSLVIGDGVPQKDADIGLAGRNVYARSSGAGAGVASVVVAS